MALGYAIHGLYVNAFENNLIVLHCKNNDSRFRPGDRLTFEMPGEKAFSGILVNLQHGGRLLVDSIPDRGTTILFTLPVPERSEPHA